MPVVAARALKSSFWLLTTLNLSFLTVDTAASTRLTGSATYGTATLMRQRIYPLHSGSEKMSQDSTDSIALQPGTLDPSFAEDGVITAPGQVRTIAVDENGTLTYAIFSSAEFLVYRALSDGSPDGSFGENGFVRGTFADGIYQSMPRRVLLQKDRKTVLIGNAQTSMGNGNPAVTRFNENGSPDLAFGTRVLPFPRDDVIQTGLADGCLQEDGKILLTFGYLMISEGTVIYEAGLLIRLNSDGELDTDFCAGRGFVEVRFKGQDTTIASVVVQSDGTIIVGGHFNRSKDGRGFNTLALAGYKPDGQLDQGFGEDGYVTLNPTDHNSTSTRLKKLVLQQDKLVCAGSALTDMGIECLLMRFNANGSPDLQFNRGNPVFTYFDFMGSTWDTVAVQSDNKIVVSGQIYKVPNNPFILGRFNADGTPDASFAGGGFLNSYPGSGWGSVIQKKTGRIIIAGSSYNVNGVYGFLG